MSAPDDVAVSKDEMDALMETIRESGETWTRELDGEGDLRDVVRYDLVAARTVNGGQLPTLDLINERFAGLIAEALTRECNRKVEAKAAPARPLKFMESLGALPEPACIQVVELIGLRGTGLVVFDPALLFHLFDLVLGGNPTEVADAESVLKARGLTMVERRLFAHLVRTVAAQLGPAWEGVAELSLRPVRAETQPKHAAIFEPGDMVVDSAYELSVAGCTGKLHVIIPQSALRPLEKQLASGMIDQGGDEAVSWAVPLTNLLQEVTALTTAELGRTTITLRRLLGLKVGEIIRLDREPDNPITVYVEGSAKLSGRPTVSHGNIAIEVTDLDGDIELTPCEGQPAPFPTADGDRHE